MDIQSVKEKFYNEHPNAIAQFMYNEKLGKFICFTFDALESSTLTFDYSSIKTINEHKGSLDPASAVVDYINKKMPDFYPTFSEFYVNVVINDFEKYQTVEQICEGLNNYVNAHKTSSCNTSKRSTIRALVVNNNGELDDSIFSMDLTFENKTCYIESSFTEPDYRKMGLHGASIKFLERVLASRNIYTIRGESKAYDVFESTNSSTLEQHYKKLGFDVDFEDDGTYTLYKCVDPNLTLER